MEFCALTLSRLVLGPRLKPVKMVRCENPVSCIAELCNFSH